MNSQGTFTRSHICLQYSKEIHDLLGGCLQDLRFVYKSLRRSITSQGGRLQDLRFVYKSLRRSANSQGAYKISYLSGLLGDPTKKHIFYRGPSARQACVRFCACCSIVMHGKPNIHVLETKKHSTLARNKQIIKNKISFLTTNHHKLTLAYQAILCSLLFETTKI